MATDGSTVAEEGGLVHVEERCIWLPMPGSNLRLNSRVAIGFLQSSSGHLYFLKVQHTAKSIAGLIRDLAGVLDDPQVPTLSRAELALRIEVLSGHRAEILASDPEDLSSWELEGWWRSHTGLLARTQVGCSISEIKQQAESDRSSVAKLLLKGIERVRGNSYHGAMTLPVIDGVSWVRLGNYLCCSSEITQRNRIQAATLFPLLIYQILMESDHTPWIGELSEAIDSGRPLISFLTQQLSVRPATVRVLRNLDPATVGDFWKCRVRELLWLISELPPERYPTDKGQWEALAQQVQLQSSLSKSPICTTASRILVSALARRNWLPLTNLSNNFIEEASLLDQFRDDLLGSIKAITLVQAKINGRLVPEIDLHQDVTNKFSSLGFKTTLKLARKWRSYPKPDEQYWRGFDFPLLLKEPFERDGVSIHQLSGVAELDAESQTMNNCVSTYAGLCRQGRSLIFAVRDRNALSLSNVELSVTRQGVRKFSVDIVQHSGRGNLRPPKAAMAPVSAFIDFLRSDLASPMLQDFFHQKFFVNLDPDVKRNLTISKVMESFLNEHARGRLVLSSFVTAEGNHD